MEWLARLFGFNKAPKKTEIQLLAELLEERLSNLNKENG